MSRNESIADALIDQYLLGTISEDDRKRLLDWFDAFTDDEVEVILEKRTSALEAKEVIWHKIEKRVGLNASVSVQPAGKSSKGLRRVWRYSAVAAACLLMAFLGWWFLLGKNKKPAPLISIAKKAQVNKGLSNHDGAVLTLSNGQVIQLDSMGIGQIALQGGARVVQKGNQVVYEHNGGDQAATPAMLNTMSTPKGKQFALQLPDGTKVWLNAASSICYPVRFDADKRKVDVTGEVYFEVAHVLGADKRSRVPFEVHTGNVAIDVLGTHFDVKNYEDEKKVKATLVEGRIQVVNKVNNSMTTILPGQQASVNKTGIGIIAVDQVDALGMIAWKEGLFNFKDEPLEEILRQVARWYDVQVDADPRVKRLRFSGVVSKRAKLADLLKVLSATGVVEFKISEHGVYGY